MGIQYRLILPVPHPQHTLLQKKKRIPKSGEPNLNQLVLLWFPLPANRSVIDLAIPGRFPRNRCPWRTAFTIIGFGNFRSANAQLIGNFKIFIAMMKVRLFGPYFSIFIQNVQFDIDISDGLDLYVKAGLRFTFFETKISFRFCTKRDSLSKGMRQWTAYHLQPSIRDWFMMQSMRVCAMYDFHSFALLMHQFFASHINRRFGRIAFMSI